MKTDGSDFDRLLRLVAMPELARDPDADSLTNSVIQLRAQKVPRPQSPGQDVQNYVIKFEVSNSFTPYRKAWHDYNDMDIASTGVLLIPGTRFLAAAGKEGIIYLLNGMRFGGFQRVADWDYQNMLTKLPKKQAEEPDDPALDYMHQKFQAGINTYQNDPNPQIRDANTVRLSDWPNWPHIHGTPVDIAPHVMSTRARRKAPTKADIEAALSVAGAWEGHVDFDQLKRDLQAAQWDDNTARSL